MKNVSNHTLTSSNIKSQSTATKVSILSAAVIAASLNLTSPQVGAQTKSSLPTCEFPENDAHIDGYGWENGASCEVRENSLSLLINSAPTTSGSQGGQCLDIDGDGYGWNGVETCYDFPGGSNSNQQITVNNTSVTNIDVGMCTDHDNDGYGWNGVDTCYDFPVGSNSNQQITVNDTLVESSVEVSNINKKIQDLVASAGQSNALGTGTPIPYELDSTRRGLYAFQDYRQWKESDQCNQGLTPGISDLPGYPAHLTDPHRAKSCNASMALEIAEGLLDRDSESNVGTISTGSPGMDINHWDEGSSAYINLVEHLSAALNADEASEVDRIYISWHQGEANHGSDINWYKNKVQDLHRRLIRDLGVTVVLVGNSSAFIPENNTYSDPFHKSMNKFYETLAYDGDPNTCYVDLSDLQRKDIAHFTSASIRIAGRTRIAQVIHNHRTGNLDGSSCG